MDRRSSGQSAALGGAQTTFPRPSPVRAAQSRLSLLREVNFRCLHPTDTSLYDSLLQYFLPHLDHGGEEITYINNSRIDVDKRLIQS